MKWGMCETVVWDSNTSQWSVFKMYNFQCSYTMNSVLEHIILQIWCSDIAIFVLLTTTVKEYYNVVVEPNHNECIKLCNSLGVFQFFKNISN